MSHVKTLKESIRDIILNIKYPDGYINETEIEKAVNNIDLLITTLLRNERLGIKGE